MYRPKKYTPALLCAWLLASVSIHAQVTNSLRLTSLDAVSGGWRLGWPALGTNSAYSVQFQDTVQDQIWRLSDSPVPLPVSSNAWLSPNLTNSSRFFRVIGVPAANRGRIVSVNLSNTLSTATLAFLFSLAGVTITPQYDVQMYRVIYETIDPNG